MSVPFFSIALTCYNYEKYVAQAIESVSFQSFRDFELLISDDCSTDNSKKRIEETLERLGERFSGNVRVLSWEKNHGVCRLRNNIFGQATGRYFLYLDADDIMLPDFLESLHQIMSLHPDRHVFQFYDIWYQTEEKRILSYNNVELDTGKQVYPIVESYIDFLEPRFQSSGGGNFILSRECFLKLGGFDYENFKHGWEDFDLWMRAVKEYGCVPTFVQSLIYRMYKPESSRGTEAWKDRKKFATLVRMMLRKHPEMCITGYVNQDRVYFPEDFQKQEYPFPRKGFHRFRKKRQLIKYKRV